MLVLTDRRQADRPLPEVIAAAVAGGARRVVLREKDLPPARRAELADRLREVLAPVGGTLIVAGPDPLGGRAVHLAVADPQPTGMTLIGRSCHGAAEVDRLATEDYATVSPVFATRSKPGYGPPLRPAGLAALVARTGKPLLALGGVSTPDQAAQCRDAGAAGVAVMGALMRSPDPAGWVAALLCEVPA
jgi:thiamine monophosphate synthase